MTPQEIATEIERVLRDMTDLSNGTLTPENHKSLASAYVLVKRSGFKVEEDDLKVAIEGVMGTRKTHPTQEMRDAAADKIQTILHRVVAMIGIDNPA